MRKISYLKIVGLSALLGFFAAFAKQVSAQQNLVLDVKDFGFVKPKRIVETKELPISEDLERILLVKKITAEVGGTVSVSNKFSLIPDLVVKGGYRRDTIYFYRYEPPKGSEDILGEACKYLNIALQADSLKTDAHENQHAVADRILKTLIPGRELSFEQLYNIAVFDELMANVAERYHTGKDFDINLILKSLLSSKSYNEQFKVQMLLLAADMVLSGGHIGDSEEDFEEILQYMSYLWNPETGRVIEVPYNRKEFMEVFLSSVKKSVNK